MNFTEDDIARATEALRCALMGLPPPELQRRLARRREQYAANVAAGKGRKLTPAQKANKVAKRRERRAKLRAAKARVRVHASEL